MSQVTETAANDEPTEIIDTVEREGQTSQETSPEAEDEPVDGEENEQDDDGSDDEPSDDAQPKKPNRYQRMKRQNELMRQELDEYRRRTAGSEPSGEKRQVDIGPEPKLEDFNGDWFAYERARGSYDLRKVLAEERAGADERQADARRQEQAMEARVRYGERVADFAKTTADFADVVSASKVQIPNAALELIVESDKGPLLAYHLAKNPAVAERMQGMTPAQIAREIGRLEGSLRLPTAKTQSTAPAPVRPAKGGAAPAPDPSKMSMEEYAAWRLKGR